jgi:AcrR family transcriptional regulator
VASDRQLEILNAGAALFREKGFAAVGVDEIGAAAGVTGPAIYRHFSGKDEILSVLFDEGMDEVLRVTAGSFEDPHEELRHIVHEHALHVLRNPRLAGVWIHESRALVMPYRRRFLRRAEQYVDRWVEVIQRCHPDVAEEEALTITHSSIGALNSVNGWPRVLRDETHVQLLTEMVVHGVSVLGEPHHRPG